jgi:glutathione synthase/RimK-type ligase-like ATP-grasp enzyme
MKVELLWWEGCPSHPEALEDLERVLREEGIDAEVELVEVENDEQAHREGFPGSPTIRLDGEDAIAPAEGEPFSLTCRIYHLRDGRVSATPDPEDLRDAVRRINANR